MFSNLFFLISALLLINFSPETLPIELSTELSFGISLIGYTICLALIGLQNWLFSHRLRPYPGLLLAAAQIELLLFLTWDLYFVGGHRVFLDVPYLKNSQTALSLGMLLFYIAGLAFFYFTSAAGALKRVEVSHQLRMVVPFLLPFLFFTALLDIFLYVQNPMQAFMARQPDWAVETFLLILSGLFLVACMIFLPYFIQKIWKCRPLLDQELKERLERLCVRAEFRHGGMMLWTVMNRAHTAAILGTAPRFRYVMFTQRLLHYLSIQEVEAILAHEIGHSKRKHMFYYPFVIMGMLAAAGLFSLFFSVGIAEYLYLKKMLHPSFIWKALEPLSNVVPYILIAGIYFRLIFGYFSRLFERQADLYVFYLGIAPVHLIHALDQVAVATGGTHRQPSWHHYSIQERMDFLEQAALEPAIIKKHDSWVRWSLRSYFFLLGTIILCLFAPVMPKIFPFKQISSWEMRQSSRFSGWLNHSLREQASQKRQQYEQ